MASIQLTCAVLGEDTPFTVTIMRDAYVSELRDAISKSLPSNGHPTKPAMLKLYLTWKNDAWLKLGQRSGTEHLAGDAVDPEIPIMHPLLKTESSMCLSSESPPDNDASVNTWQRVYDVLAFLTTSMLQANSVKACTHRRLVDHAGTAIERKRPDFFFIDVDGLVLMRGDLNPMSVDMETSVRQLTSTMRVWNPTFYGDLPFMIGFVASGSTLRVVAIEACGPSIDQEVLFEFDVLGQPAEAIRVFFNLALLFNEMVRLVKRPFANDLTHFLPYEYDERTIVVLDDHVEQTIKHKSTKDTQRLHEVYTALTGMKTSGGSETTHLQTVDKLSVQQNGELVIALSPVGVVWPPRLEEVGALLRDMLTALTCWHGCGYCHGDVRACNIIHVPNGESGYWVLIGMVKSYTLETREINWNHAYHGDTLRFQHDLFQVGKLMEELGYDVPDHLKTVQTMLLAGIDAVELTAEMALAKLAELLQDSPPAQEFCA